MCGLGPLGGVGVCVERYSGEFDTLAEAPDQPMLILIAWRPKLVLCRARDAVLIFRLLSPIFRVS